MEYPYELQQRALKEIRKNRTDFLNNMDTLVVVNTNIISNNLHPAHKEQVEAIMTQNGNYCANIKLLEILCKSDRGGEYLLHAFKEIEHTLGHEKLYRILRKAFTPTSQPVTNRIASQPASTLPSQPITNSILSQPGMDRELQYSSSAAVQETNNNPDPPIKTSQEETRRKTLSNVNQLSELTSTQNDNVVTDSTTCNNTDQSTPAKSPNSHCDINKNYPKKSEKSKEIPFLGQNNDCPNPNEVDNRQEILSEAMMSDSFVISESSLEEAFNEGSSSENEIENLKYPENHDSRDSQTYPKQPENGDDADGDIHRDDTNVKVVAERSEACSEGNHYQSSNFIDIHVGNRNEEGKLSVDCGSDHGNFGNISTTNMDDKTINHSFDGHSQTDAVDENTLLKTVLISSTDNAFPNNGENAAISASEIKNSTIDSLGGALPKDSINETEAKCGSEIKVSTSPVSDSVFSSDGHDEHEASGIDQQIKKEAMNGSVFPSRCINETEAESGNGSEIQTQNGHTLEIAFPRDSVNENGAMGGSEPENFILIPDGALSCDSVDENGEVSGNEIDNSIAFGTNSTSLINRFQSCPERDHGFVSQSLEERNNQSDEYEERVNHTIQRTVYFDRSNSMPAGGNYFGLPNQFMYKKFNACKGITGTF